MTDKFHIVKAAGEATGTPERKPAPEIESQACHVCGEKKLAAFETPVKMDLLVGGTGITLHVECLGCNWKSEAMTRAQPVEAKS